MYSLDSLVSKESLRRRNWRRILGIYPGRGLVGLARNYQNSQYATYKEHNQDATVMFRYRKEKVRFKRGNFRAAAEDLHGLYQGKLDTTVVRNVLNWAPRIDFRYKFSETGQLRLRYNGRSSQPSMTNLLDVTRPIPTR